MTDDHEVKALIQVGHTFGKAMVLVWSRTDTSRSSAKPLHGTGICNDTVTSNLEGPWTTHPMWFLR